MAADKSGFRVAVAMVLAMGGWFACSSADHPLPDGKAEAVATTRQALNPLSPGNLPDARPVAWYVALPDNGHIALDASGNVQQWTDVSVNASNVSNGNHLVQNNPPARPHFNPAGWSQSPQQGTITFANSLLERDNWSATPAGTDTPLTVIAVLRTRSTADATVAGWWDPNGGGYAWAGIKLTGGLALPDMGRTYGLSDTQTFTGPHDLGTAGPVPDGRFAHVVAWRYLPASHTIKLTVDGAMAPPSSELAAIGPMPQMPFIVGAGTPLPTRLFQGDISELAVYDAPLTDDDIESVTDYFRSEWTGLPTPGSIDPCIDANNHNTTARCDDGIATTYGDQCLNGICSGTVPPSGSPADLAPLSGWYHAGDVEITLRDGGVETWFDRSTHHLDLSTGFYNGRPTVAPDFWDSTKPHPVHPLVFSGHNALFRLGWSGKPDGNDADFTVLAVIQPKTAQTCGVASWSSYFGGGRIGCDVKTTGSGTFLDLFRIDIYNGTQDFTGPTTIPLAKHVFAWRYSPGRMQLTVDGVNSPSTTTLPTLDVINPERFMVGADYVFANTLLNANLAELVLIPRAINDAELAHYDSYVATEWGAINFCQPSCATCGVSDGCGGICCDTACASDAQCPTGFGCNAAGQCQLGGPPANCSDGVKDGDETDVDCGGSCPACDVNHECGADTDCGSGLVCGQHNGGCFDGSRAKNVCWPAACADGVDGSECGTPDSPCGQNCDCIKVCNVDDPNSTCASGDVCREGIGTLFNAATRDVCIPSGINCPSNDPAYCGTTLSVCGPLCIPTPDCSHATCANPDDGAGGVCPGVCPVGGQCTNDVQCPTGSSCRTDGSGLRSCWRDDLCPPGPLVPPRCGSAGAPCGAVCPTYAHQCDGRDCGPDPVFGQSCGSCSGGAYCSLSGKCVTPTSDPPPQVPDGNGAQVPLQSLPTTPTNPVGAVKGGFSVSERGTAEYDIPIEVPPGRAGMAPTLSLHYTGANQYTDGGTGWHLEGLSKITRCPRTFALDGYAGPIKNDETDQFCLDGQRLIAKAPGVYGADGTVYHTVIDSFSKVTSRKDPDGQAIEPDPFPNVTQLAPSAQGPDYFEVRTREGRTLTFGHTRDSLGFARTGLRYTWLLSQVRDRAGNTIVVHYHNESDTASSFLDDDKVLVNEIYPLSITYTGHGDTEGNRTVSFNYEPRTDYSYFRFQQGGLDNVGLKRLGAITTYVDNQPVRTYGLHYIAGQYVSQVDSITECARDGSDATQCKPPTKFTYQHEMGFTTAKGTGDDLASAVKFDVDGDGRLDLLHTYVTVDGVPANGTLEVAAIITNQVGNIIIGATLSTGVGIPVSILFSILNNLFWGAFAAEPVVHIRNVLTFTQPNRDSALRTVGASGLPCLDNEPLFLLDYDRDGKDDLLGYCGFSAAYRGSSSYAGLTLALSQGTGQFAPGTISGPTSTLDVPTYITSSTRGGGGTWTPAELPAPTVFDVDGDGLEDIVNCPIPTMLQVRRRISPTEGFDAPIVYTKQDAQGKPLQVPFCELNSGASAPVSCARCTSCNCTTTGDNVARPTYNIMDVDGDGVAELLVSSSSGWQVLRYAKNGETAQLKFEPITFTDTDQSNMAKGLMLSDYNGDGLVDIAQINGSNVNMWINTGGNRFLSRKLTRPMPAHDQGYNFARAALLDYDGDGRTDFLEHWQLGSASYNVPLSPDANMSALSVTPTMAIRSRLSMGLVAWLATPSRLRRTSTATAIST